LGLPACSQVKLAVETQHPVREENCGVIVTEQIGSSPLVVGRLLDATPIAANTSIACGDSDSVTLFNATYAGAVERSGSISNHYFSAVDQDYNARLDCNVSTTGALLVGQCLLVKFAPAWMDRCMHECHQQRCEQSSRQLNFLYC